MRDVMGQATVIGEGVNQINFNKLITLNSSAAFLWRQVEGKDFDESMLADLLVEEYGIDRELAEKIPRQLLLSGSKLVLLNNEDTSGNIACTDQVCIMGTCI